MTDAIEQAKYLVAMRGLCPASEVTTSLLALSKAVLAYERVVEAAKAWRSCYDEDGYIVNRLHLGDAEVELCDALDALTGKDASK